MLSIETILITAPLELWPSARSLAANALLSSDSILKQLNEVAAGTRKHLSIQSSRKIKWIDGKRVSSIEEKPLPTDIEQNFAADLKEQLDATTYDKREQLALREIRIGTQEAVMARDERASDGIVKLHIGGKHPALSTNLGDEPEFLRLTADALAAELGDDKAAGRLLVAFLPLVVDVCCKLRGYKANVVEHRIIIAGQVTPADVVEAFPPPYTEPRRLVRTGSE